MYKQHCVFRDGNTTLQYAHLQGSKSLEIEVKNKCKLWKDALFFSSINEFWPYHISIKNVVILNP